MYVNPLNNQSKVQNKECYVDPSKSVFNKRLAQKYVCAMADAFSLKIALVKGTTE